MTGAIMFQGFNLQSRVLIALAFIAGAVFSSTVFGQFAVNTSAANNTNPALQFDPFLGTTNITQSSLSGTASLTPSAPDCPKPGGSPSTPPPPPPPPVQCGLTATIGFWHTNGVKVIDDLNGGGKSTALSSWLTSNFGNLYGSSAGSNNLTGKTDAQVASYYQSLFNQSGTKTGAQLLAVALAVYSTDSVLAGTSNIASKYGFTVTSTGLGVDVFNVGVDGAAIGVSNNSVLPVLQILLDANKLAVKGSIYDSKVANDLFDRINIAGDIP